MNEPEVLEIINLFASNAMTSFSIWATFTFAYLTAAYLAGSQLTKFQVITVSSLYFAAAGAFALSGITHLRSIDEIFSAYPDFVPSDYWNLPWTVLGFVMTIGGMGASLYFLYDIRKQAH